MSADSWLIGNASLQRAEEKYGYEFAVAYRLFRDPSTSDEQELSDRAALWNDFENRGENVMGWYRARRC